MMNNPTRRGKRVFISYAREDFEHAQRLYFDLKKAGADPWLDAEELLPGQKWQTIISDAIRESDFFLALLSSGSISKKGYVQKELREALEVFDQIPENEVYIVPARLDECRPSHPRLKDIHWVDLFPEYDSGFRKILLVIRPPEAVASGGLKSAPILDPNDLSQTGWGVIFSADGDPGIRKALEPLLKHRRAEAGSRFDFFYREFQGASGYQPGELKTNFLAKHGVGPGPADPNRMPYYLLLVGGPEEIPFDFQYQLSLQYRVGRIHFETYDEYERYGQNVIAAETQLRRSRSSSFFGVENLEDRATNIAVTRLVQPLADSVAIEHPSWSVQTLLSERATKDSLRKLLDAELKPTLLFIVAHGLVVGRDNDHQMQIQGSIVCRDWPGPEVPVSEDHYFSAADIPSHADLRGVTLFYFGSYSAGTSRNDDFAPIGESRQLANRSFVSQLAKRMLGKENGALAFIGHVNNVWLSSFEWRSAGPQLQTFEAALRSLFRGERVGLALHYFSQRYAELSAELAHRLQVTNEEKVEEDIELLRLAALDSRNYILIGDPAARPLLNGQGKI